MWNRGLDWVEALQVVSEDQTVQVQRRVVHSFDKVRHLRWCGERWDMMCFHRLHHLPVSKRCGDFHVWREVEVVMFGRDLAQRIDGLATHGTAWVLLGHDINSTAVAGGAVRAREHKRVLNLLKADHAVHALCQALAERIWERQSKTGIPEAVCSLAT